jgi:hypothetical protein
VVVPSGSWWFLAIIGVFCVLCFFGGFNSSGSFLIVFFGSFVVLCGPLLFVVILQYFGQFLVVFGGSLRFWWLLVVPNGFWWFLLVLAGSWWFLVVFGGFWWFSG